MTTTVNYRVILAVDVQSVAHVINDITEYTEGMENLSDVLDDSDLPSADILLLPGCIYSADVVVRYSSYMTGDGMEHDSVVTIENTKIASDEFASKL